MDWSVDRLFPAHARQIVETALGPEHPESARCMAAQAALLRGLDRDGEATRLGLQAEIIRTNRMAQNGRSPDD